MHRNVVHESRRISKSHNHCPPIQYWIFPRLHRFPLYLKGASPASISLRLFQQFLLRLQRIPKKIVRLISLAISGMDAKDVEEDEFGFSRNYFLAKDLRGSGKKSTRKLSDIDLVDEQELREAASRIEIKHEKDIGLLVDSYKSLYSKWAFDLRCGFGLLMYGFGSKKSLLEDFASSALTDSGVVVMNGYLQSVNIKQVVIALAELLWDQMKAKRKTSIGGLQKTQQPFSSQSMEDLIAFMDGSQMKDSDLWDKKMVHTQFNWCWYHVPTFMPYKLEGMFFPLILASSGTSQNAKTAAIVLQRMPVNDLYGVCRERFLVSSQVTLNSHLTEFKDHELVKTRRHSDGQDCLYIPLTSEALQKVLQQI
ncbi:hypothetical protein Sjap_017226 [Stephania japonica]|uniref:Origin recognition complex subunit 2 n=1 Tax=Stephania japonica TaxID=461633 RepID=A0AAP0NLR4_9MAGN